MKATGKAGTEYAGKEFYAVKRIDLSGKSTENSIIKGFIETSSDFSGDNTPDTVGFDPEKMDVTDVRLINNYNTHDERYDYNIYN